MENEQADAGRDGQTHIVRPNSQPRAETGTNLHFTCSVDHEQNQQPYPVDPYSAMYDGDQTYSLVDIRIWTGTARVAALSCHVSSTYEGPRIQ